MRISSLFLLFLFLFNYPLASQTTVKIWDNEIATKKMKQASMVAFIAENNPDGLSVIICPGGSYCYLGTKKEGLKVAKWFQDNGISAFVLRYRVAMRKNKYPAMIQDLQRGIQLVKENYAMYCIDTCKVGVLGFSAGGHLAGTAATFFDTNYMEELGIEPTVSLRPDFAAMIYPVVSMTDSLSHKRSRRNLLGKHYSTELKHMMSLELNVHDQMPPVFMIHCKKDKTVDYRNSSNYNLALRNKGVRCDFTLYDEKGHGFGINPDSPKAPSWINNFLPWLRDIGMIE
jgi:acetyl esterase/lipase